MTERAASRRPASAAVRRRRAVALCSIGLAAVAGAVAVGVGSSGGPPAKPAPRFLDVRLGGRLLARRPLAALSRPGAVAGLLTSVPATRESRRGKARIVYAVDRQRAAAAVRRAIRAGGGSVAVPESPAAAFISVPLIRQVLPDDCEATALSMVLGYSGRPVGQLALQRQVAEAKPVEPTTAADGSEVWGDPSVGFVGDAAGGGFGVYQGPIKALAARHGLRLRELSGSRPSALYAALLHGHPLIAWVALAEGPYATWHSPSGKRIEINWGEHALVVTGVDGDRVEVNDPLSGRRLSWTKEEFERMWDGLGRRALAA